MKLIRIAALALGLVLGTVSLAGCNGASVGIIGGADGPTEIIVSDGTPAPTSPGATPNVTPNPTKQAVQPQGFIQVSAPAALPVELADHDMVVKGNDFAFRLLAAMDDQQAILSPISLSMALSAVANGADEAALAAICKTLGTDMTLSELNDYNAHLMAFLREDVGVQLANGSFINAGMGLALQPGFAQALADYYRADAASLDFRDPAALTEINGWISEHTNGMIPEMLEELSPSMYLLVANALYFKDGWMNEFNPELTKDDTFHGQKGDTTVPMMQSDSADNPYFENDALQAITLPYLNGCRMMVMLPKSGTPQELLANMDGAAYQVIADGMKPGTGTLYLPKFKAEWGGDLTGVLDSMGLSDVTARGTASLSGMIEDLQDRLFIDCVLHKVVVDVNEKGTEAAAATIIGMRATGIMESIPYEMRVDRPFAFTITGPSGEILFIGTINDL